MSQRKHPWESAILLLVSGNLLVGGMVSASAADFDIRNESVFKAIVPDDAEVRKLASGMRFLEGPVWMPEGYLVFSDIPANELKKWHPESGLATFRKPSHQANGNVLDRQGRLVTCEHASHRVSRTSKDGEVVTLVSAYQGDPLNSPNDLAVKSDGTIWFTDPSYGLGDREMAVPGQWVYRYDPANDDLQAVARDFDRPNGIAFSPNEETLYIADSGSPHHIRAFDVVNGQTLRNGRVFCQIDKGAPDGIRIDAQGRLYSSAGDGIQIFSANGNLIGKIFVPETPANLCFGGKDYQTLFITARSSLYAIDLNATGARAR